MPPTAASKTGARGHVRDDQLAVARIAQSLFNDGVGLGGDRRLWLKLSR